MYARIGSGHRQNGYRPPWDGRRAHLGHRRLPIPALVVYPLEELLSDRQRAVADEGAVRSSSAAMSALTCSRRTLAIAAGASRRVRQACPDGGERGRERAVIGGGADGPDDRLDASRCSLSPSVPPAHVH